MVWLGLVVRAGGEVWLRAGGEVRLGLIVWSG